MVAPSATGSAAVNDVIAQSEEISARLDDVIAQQEKERPQPTIEASPSADSYEQQFNVLDNELIVAIERKDEVAIKDICDRATRLFPLIPQWRSAVMTEYEVSTKTPEQEDAYNSKLRTIDTIMNHFDAREILEVLHQELDDLEVQLNELRNKINAFRLRQSSQSESEQQKANELKARQAADALRASMS